MPGDTSISEAQSEKILAFVEREAGRDAPLSPEDEKRVRELLATDPEAQALADEFRDSDTGLKVMFQAFDNMPVSEELIERMRAPYEPIALRSEEDEENDTVVPFSQKPAAQRRSYGPLAMAASLALMVAGGGLLYQYQGQQRLEQAMAELEGDRSTLQGRVEQLAANTGSLQDELAAVGAAREDAETALSTANSDIARLHDELASITNARDDAESALAETTRNLASLRETEASLKLQMAELEEQAQQLATQSTKAREALQTQLKDVQAELANATEARRTAEAEVTDADRTIGELIDEGAVLNTKVAELEAETSRLTSNVAARESALRESRAELAQAERRIAELATERLALAAAVNRGDEELDDLQAALAALQDGAAALKRERDELATAIGQRETDLTTARTRLTSAQQQTTAFQTALETLRQQTDWRAQVAGYHIGYASTMKMREVEVRAAEQRESQALTKWLSSELGHDITVPRNLPMPGGLTFVGGRMLYTIEGQPIAQIAYHDSEGQLTAFCIKRNPTGAINDELKQAQFFGQLQMIHWQDETLQYALVGFADFETLTPVAAWLESNYDEDT